MNGVPATDPEALIAETDWLRALVRTLVRPEHVEDVCQETLVRTWRAAPALVHGPRPWLARVARNLAAHLRTGERRRLRRERDSAQQRVAEGSHEPPTADVVARFQLHRAVSAAIDTLAEPYRTTILLRFFDDLPPSAIAARMAVPVETVRTRIKRGLSMLRARLDHAHGGRDAWSLPLSLWCGAEASVAGAVVPVVLLSSLLMKKLELVVAAGLLLAVILVVWANSSTIGRDESATPSTSSSATARVGDDAAPQDSSRVAIAPPSATNPGATSTLAVHVRWQDSGAPAASIGVWLDYIDGPLLGLTGLTDAHGIVRFDHVTSGLGTVRPDRGGGGESITLRAGEHHEATLRLARGKRVRGIVVDPNGTPVQGADVLLSEAPGGPDMTFCVAHTEPDGTFELAGLGSGSVVGARAALRGTSTFVLVSGAPIDVTGAAALRLVLPDATATIEGCVRDAAGRALPGVLVCVGLSTWAETYRTADGWAQMPPAQHMLSDADGRFVARELRPSVVPVVVYARGRAPRTEVVELTAGEHAHLDITLLASATLSGTVVDNSGTPLAGVEIESEDARFPERHSVTTAADGTYRFDDQPPSTRRFFVRDERGRARTELTFRAGEVSRWDVTLDPGRAITGIVQDEQGKPITGWSLSVDDHDRLTYIDAEGRFAVHGCTDRAHRLFLYDRQHGGGPVVHSVDGIRPGQHTIVVPASARARSRITGSLVDVAERPPSGATIEVMQEGYWIDLHSDIADDGHFAVGPLPPGRYSITIHARGLPDVRLRGLTVVAGQDLELGQLRFAVPGDVDLTLPGARAEDYPHLRITVRDADGRYVQEAMLEPNHVRATALAPGHYLLCLEGHRFAARVWRCEVRAGETARLQGTLERATPLWLRIERGPGRAPLVLHVEIRDESGALQFMARGHEGADYPLEMDLALPPGSYRVRATHLDETIVEQDVTVLAATAEQQVIVLR